MREGSANASQSQRPLKRCAEASRKPGVDMSKIPQGEWSAIAARYAKGESISRIAQSYGCTPPAIHYILKRSKQRAALNIQQPLQATPHEASNFTHRPALTSGGPEISRAVRPPLAELPGTAGAAPSESGQSMVQPAELRSALGRENAPTQQMPNGRFQSVVEKQASGGPRKTGRPSAFTAGLDS